MKRGGPIHRKTETSLSALKGERVRSLVATSKAVLNCSSMGKGCELLNRYKYQDKLMGLKTKKSVTLAICE